ncbi:MAG: hypothetical protein JNM94_14195 [Phycisphaerae bacterium]|nr:hypothetical protein [Phycisphaerae bacterium]
MPHVSARTPSLVASVIGMLSVSTAALGSAIVPVSQVRSASADSFVVLGPTSEQDIVDIVAPTLAPFSIAFDTNASLANGTASFDVSQDSAFLPFGFVAEGAAASTSTIVAPGGFCYSVGSSSATVTFTVAAGTAYRLGAALHADANGQTKLSLSGSGGVVVSESLIGDDESVRVAGTLSGGTWTLHVSSFSSTSLTNPGTMVDDAAFTLFLSTSPSAADLDLDGSVNASDLGLLLGAWGPCDACIADIDASGTVDAADLAALLGDWS